MDEFNPNIPDVDKIDDAVELPVAPVAEEPTQDNMEEGHVEQTGVDTGLETMLDGDEGAEAANKPIADASIEPEAANDEPVSDAKSEDTSATDDDGESLDMVAEAQPDEGEVEALEATAVADKPVEEKKDDEKKTGSMPPRPPVEPKKGSKAPLVVMGLIVVLAVGLGAYVFLNGGSKEPVETPPAVETAVPTPSATPEATPEPTPTPTATPTPTPEPTPTVVIDVEGKISSINEETLAIIVGDETSEYFYDDTLEETVATLTADTDVKFTYTVDGTDMVITALEVVEKIPEIDNEVVPPEATPSMEDVFAEFKNELQIIQQREPTEVENPDEPNLPAGEKIETLTLEAQVPTAGDTWFRFSWKKNDTTPVVPGVNDVVVELKTPSGTLINQDNISRYGRFWLEGNILNYAIKNAAAGTWAFCVTKSESQSLGDIGANLVPLTGFITIDKISIDYVGDDLYAIWKISGVKDECYGITINAKNANGSNILVYSGSTSDGLHLIDTVKLSTAKLPSGTYDFEIVVQDWDASAVNGVQRITSKSMTHTVTLEGIEIR